MAQVPLVRVAALRPVVRLLGRIGAPIERLLVGVGLSPEVIRHGERAVPLVQGVRFLNESARTQGIHDLGFRAGRELPLTALGLFGSVLVQSRTLAEGIDWLLYAGTSFNVAGRWRLDRRGGVTWLRQKVTAPRDAQSAQADHYSLSLALQFLQLAAGPTWRPAVVQLQTARAPALADHPLLAGARIEFERAETSIAFPTALLTQPLRSSGRTEVAGGDMSRWLSSSPPSGFVESVSEVMWALAPRCGHPRIHTTAEAFGMSSRTLQRRLAQQGYSFEQLLRSARLDLAAAQLRQTDARILDIALDLGYSDHAHFTRAFRRWTGLSPLQYRRMHREEPDASSDEAPPMPLPDQLPRPQIPWARSA